MGVLSSTDGTFRLAAVPAGGQRVQAQRIGYRAASAAIVVAAGQSIVLNFELESQALALDEIVVTGTAGGTQLRAVGNIVERMDVGEMIATNAGAISNVEHALSGRVPGVELVPAPGVAGGGGQIRLRGSSSASLPGDPIIYVDGVRMNSDRGQVNRHTSISRLNDIDPRDIESIEVIKGPAAATLYGTEASNGVIQIITKRGTTGAPVFDASVDVGAMWLPVGYVPTVWAPDPARCPTLPCGSIDDLVPVNLHESELARGNRLFEPGMTQRYNLAVRGGSDLIRYYASVNRADQRGVVDWNWDTRSSVRASLAVTPSDALTFTLIGAFLAGETADAGSFWASNFGYGGRPGAYLAGDDNRGFSAPPERFQHDASSAVTSTSRSMWSFEARYQPVSWLAHRLVAGMDDFGEKNINHTLKDNPAVLYTGRCGTIGCKTVNILEAPVTTVDFSGTATYRPTLNLSLETSYGLQYYHKEATRTQSYGEDFATTALKTVGAAAVTSGSEAFVENTTVGLYLQHQFGWNDRVFLTGAVRADDNSAFGENFDAAIYPKLSATWVVHEEPFWNLSLVDQFRVRAAWGAAGQQPDAFASARLYAPNTGPNREPILTPATYGNPDLGPERGEELELGFDAEIGERVSLSYTRFQRQTRDALVAKPVAPSLGFEGETTGSTGGASQLVNIGLISAWGNELGVSIQALRRNSLRWDVNLAFSTWSNRIDDMGDAGRIQVQRGRAHVEGFPLASIIDYKVVSADFVNGVRGAVTNVMCDGGTGPNGQMPGGEAVPCSEAPRVYWGRSEPKWVINAGSSWTLFQDWSLSTTVVSQGGHLMSSDYLGARHSTSPSSEMIFLHDNAIGMAYNQISRSGLTYHKAGFVKVRELSLRYAVPSQVAERFGVNRATISTGLRNVATLYTRQACPPAEPRVCATDPEMNRPEENFWGESGGGWPPLRQGTVSLSVSF